MKVLVLSSGGIDSSTCLGLAVNKYGNENVVALSIYYGQKHIRKWRHLMQLQSIIMLSILNLI